MDETGFLLALQEAGVSTLHVIALIVGTLVLFALVLCWFRVAAIDRDETRSNERLANFIEDRRDGLAGE